MTTPHFAIYTRQSTEPRDGFSSCEAQFQVCLDFAIAAGWPDDKWVGERFDDQGYSGASLDRPAMNRLRELVRSGGIDRVCAVALDRFSRSVRDTVLLLEELERAGVEMHIVHQPQLGSSSESRFLRHILASFAQFEREIIASRIAETRAYLKKHGRRLAGPAPYGYDADPTTKQLVPNPSEARRVRAIFRRAVRGQRPSEIAKRIDHLGWRTKRWKSQRSGLTLGGCRWTARQVLAVLRNPVYTGRFADKGTTRGGCHKAVVDLGTFEGVQGQLDQRRSGSSKRRHQGQFPLRNKILCPKCKRRLCTYTITRRRGSNTLVGYRYYRCRSTAGGRAPCQGVQYPAWAIEQFLREQLAMDDEIWQSVLTAIPAGAVGHVEMLRSVWASLDSLTQDGLMPQMVESIEFRRRNSEMRITLAADSATTIMPVFAEFIDNRANNRVAGESGQF